VEKVGSGGTGSEARVLVGAQSAAAAGV